MHLSPGKVQPALSLVGYPDEVAEAIVFVFNDTLRSAPSGSGELVRAQELCAAEGA